MAKALLGIALALCLGISVAQAQQAKNPTWGQLTSEQRQILAPIQGEWDKLDAPRKRKWLGLAQRYPKMQPEAQARLQQRMSEWASLTPAQRQAAREKYREFEQLPPDERQVMRKKWDEYKQARAAEGAAKAPEAAVEQPADKATEKAPESQADSPSEGAAGAADPPSPTADPRQE